MALQCLMIYVDHDLTQYMHTILSFVWTQYFFLIGNHPVEVAEKVQLILCWNDQKDNANVSVRRWFLKTVVQIQKSHKHQESLKAVSWFVFRDGSIIWALLQRPAPGPSSLRACSFLPFPGTDVPGSRLQHISKTLYLNEPGPVSIAYINTLKLIIWFINLSMSSWVLLSSWFLLWLKWVWALIFTIDGGSK